METRWCAAAEPGVQAGGVGADGGGRERERARAASSGCGASCSTSGATRCGAAGSRRCAGWVGRAAGERLAAAAARPRAGGAGRRGGARTSWRGRRQQIAALERKIGQQALELDFFGQALQLMEAGGSAAERAARRAGVHGLIQAWAQRQGGLSVERMCALVEVSRAGYYRHWRASAPAAEETALRDRLQQLALAHRHYGYRRLGPLLRREGWAVNHKRVCGCCARTICCACARRRSCRRPPTAGMAGRSTRTWPAGWCRPTINQLWVADITYIRLAEAFVYLAVVLDAYSRRTVGWAMADHLRAELALAALRMALGQPRGDRRAAWSITPTAACSTPAATTWRCSSGTRSSPA